MSNIYLDPLDQAMAAAGIEMVRYADDFVILCRSQRGAEQALEQVRQWTVQAGLALHPVKTRIVDATQPGGFDFLGYHFERGKKWPREKSLRKFRDTTSQTRRTNGHSLRVIARPHGSEGFFWHFKQATHTFRTDTVGAGRLPRSSHNAVADKAAGVVWTITLAQCLL